MKINNLEQIKQRVIERRREDIPRGEINGLNWVLKEIEKIEERTREVRSLIKLLKNKKFRKTLLELHKEIWGEIGDKEIKSG